MKMFPFSCSEPASQRVLWGLAGPIALFWSTGLCAAVTDLANVPIASSQSGAVKPNIMILMDTSSSMSATHMPDDLEASFYDAQPIGYRSYQCNPLYYNPAETYVLPKIVDASDPALPLIDAPTPAFTAARYNYFDASDLSVVDLSASFQAFDSKTRMGLGESTTEANRSDAPQPAYYYQYSGAGQLNYKTAPCTDPLGTVVSSAGGTWTKVFVAPAQRNNFAIWYSYYRTRMALVKSGIGRAISRVDDKYRMGLISAAPLAAGNASDPNVPPAPGSAVVPDKYEPINDFDVQQRQRVYNKLYGQKPAGASPMREGLARVGRHFSDYGTGTVGDGPLRSQGINLGMPYDPVQYTCQRNFTIMTTDGYWNKGFETVGAVKMDGVTKVGQQDSPLTLNGPCEGTGNGAGPTQQCAPRPIFDGGTSGYTLEKKQNYDYQALDCSSGTDTQTVTAYTRGVEQYFLQTEYQYRETDYLQFEKTRTEKTTTTQSIDVSQLWEKVTHIEQTVTHSTRRDTVSTRTLENRSRAQTQVRRNDTQLSVKYEYVRMSAKTATKTIRTRTMDIVQWQEADNDSHWQYVLACSAGTVGTSGCRLSNASGTNIPVDPDDCSDESPTHPRYKKVTCSAVTTTGPSALDPHDNCLTPAPDNNREYHNPERRQTCVLSEVISYVDPSACTAVNNAAAIVTCSGVLTPTLSAGPASGDHVNSCSPVNSTGTNLIVPGDASAASNNYKLSCPVTVIPAPAGTTVTDAGSQQYAVDPATCAVASWAPLAASTTSNGTGLFTTCTPVIVSVTNVVYDCGGSCSTIAATGPNWIKSDFNLATVAGTVDRATCSVNSTADLAASPYTRTTCSVDSDSSYAVDTSTCAAGPSFNAVSGVTTTCSTPAGVTSTVASCPATGFNQPAAGDTTTCTTVTDSDQAVAGCTLPGSQLVNHTYACGISNTLGKPVDVGSCTPGTTTDVVTGAVTTCYAPVDVKTYVPKGNYSDVTSGKTWVVYVRTTDTALQAVAPGTCATPGAASPPSTYTSGPTTIFSNPASGGDGYTTVCSNTHTGWFQEAVGGSCTGSAVALPGWGAGWTGVSATDAVTKITATCVKYDSGAQSINHLCTPGVISGASLTKQTCSMNTVSAPVPGPSCTTGFNWNGTAYERQVCDHTTGLPSTVAHASCTPNGTATAPAYTTTTCVPDLDSWQKQSRHSTKSFEQILSGAQAVGAPWLHSTVGPTAWANEGVCTPVSVTPKPIGVIPSVDAQTAGIAPAGVSFSNGSACAAWPCVETVISPDTGSLNSLADVAQYYYATALRPYPANKLRPSSSTNPEDDRAPHIHMTTYTVGLGVSGTVAFDKNYSNPANLNGDFPAIRLGALVPAAVGATGKTDWPVWPTAAVEASLNPLDFSDPRSIDDFWHTAVNGRGKYFSAGDAYTMVTGIQSALRDIDALLAAGTAASSTTATPTLADNSVFVPSFRKGNWTGDVQARSFDLTTGSVLAGSAWSVQDALEAMVSDGADTRTIVLRKGGASLLSASDNLAHFTYATLSAAQQADFGASKVALLSQFFDMDAGQVAAAPNAALVNFLRGQRGLEDFAPATAGKLYRKRERVLGDIVDSQPVYVKEPSSNYADAGYSAFKTSSAGRKKMVYVGANDGMLHAFFAPKSSDANWTDKGKEAWAYIPSQVLPEMYKLADVQYNVNHRFYVDGTVAVGDVFDGSSWRTVLVGGLNSGGKGYYALDVTDPEKPKSLWEFTLAQDGNLGLSFGRPIISKLLNGTWVAMFTSGYNNADGQGYVYVVNAVTGALLKTVGTGAGSAANPSGLRELNNWVNNAAFDNTTQRVYGGDLLGNVWRFDVNGADGATLLATLKTTDASPTAQPVTTRIELAEIGGEPYVYVGTGRLLGLSDLADTQQQSIYSFKDIGMTYPGADVRPELKSMVITTAGSTRSIACVDSAITGPCTQTRGWVIDLPEPGERMNLNFKVGKGTLVFSSNVPAGNICSDGHGWLNYVDQVNGGTVYDETHVGVLSNSESLAVGISLIDLPHGGGSGPPCTMQGVVLGADGTPISNCVPTGTPGPIFRRISWREVDQ